MYPGTGRVAPSYLAIANWYIQYQLVGGVLPTAVARVNTAVCTDPSAQSLPYLERQWLARYHIFGSHGLHAVCGETHGVLSPYLQAGGWPEDVRR